MQAGAAMNRDRVLWGATGLLRLMLVLNIVCAAVFALALLLSWPMQDMLGARLAHKYGAMLDLDQAVLAIRMMLFVGIAGGVALHPIFSNLLRIVATVEAGDPFVDDNATRLARIGWALLALQCLDLAFGGVVRWISLLKLDVTSWTPSLGGWIAVVMIFVLARVFRIGARMRDDLAMTV